MKHLDTNIKVLRDEARLSLDELSKITNISKQRLINLEKGKEVPTEEEIQLLCKPLRISYEDMIERDIQAEREEAGKRMRKSRDRHNYNWYLGDKKKFWLYFGFLLIVILIIGGVTAIFQMVNINPFITGGIDPETGEVINVNANIFSSLAIGYISSAPLVGLCSLIWLLIKTPYRFAWWHIFWLPTIMPIVLIAGFLLVIPSLVYCFYKSVIKKGRN